MYSAKKLKELIKEEKATAKEYSKQGYKAAARDELKHAYFFSLQLKRKGRK